MPRKALINSLSQIRDILQCVASSSLQDAEGFYIGTSAGNHIRHVSDHILALIVCLESDTLDYNLRNRNSPIETDWVAADRQIEEIMNTLSDFNDDNKDITVVSEIGLSNTSNATFQSNLQREMLYLINHTIHHAAYIALLAKGTGVELPDHIGIAPATATYVRGEQAA